VKKRQYDLTKAWEYIDIKIEMLRKKSSPT